MTFNHYCNYN